MDSLASLIPADWRQALAAELEQDYWRELESFIAAESAAHEVFPPRADIFNAFRFTPVNQVKVLLLGQDPYHDVGQAHGLCFSVKPGVPAPRSLNNIFKEMASDLGLSRPDHGCLTSWAQQGILLLNTVLTVRAHEAASHSKHGWEDFTDAVIRTVNAGPQPTVFVLWGGHAAKKEELIDTARHAVIKSAHPSPLSASRGFFGSRPFSRINSELTRLGRTPVDWNLAGPTATQSNTGSTKKPEQLELF